MIRFKLVALPASWKGPNSFPLYENAAVGEPIGCIVAVVVSEIDPKASSDLLADDWR